MIEWRDVVGYEGLYSVSNTGLVFSYITGKILKFNTQNYYTVELFKNRRSKRLLVHRIVAEAFISNPNNFPQVNHKDENKLNNAVENLEWCTAKYNMKYGEMGKNRHKLIDYSKPIFKEIALKNSMAQRKPVDQFSRDGTFVASYSSAADASRMTGLNKSHIGECCNGKRYKTVGGYIWKFRKVV